MNYLEYLPMNYTKISCVIQQLNNKIMEVFVKTIDEKSISLFYSIFEFSSIFLSNYITFHIITFKIFISGKEKEETW